MTPPAEPPLPRPDALPVRPVSSAAVLPEAVATALFGAPLRGAERVEVVRLGRVVATVAAVAGPALRLVLDASCSAEPTGPGGLRLCGPVGTVDAPVPEPVAARLVLLVGLARAWGVGERAVVAVGSVAVRVAVEAGAVAGVEVDRAVWTAAGRPETARWLPQTEWGDDAPPEPVDATAFVVPRRVVTETDVRQAKLRRLTIRLAPGQVVTPAAQSLAREWGVFEAAGPAVGLPQAAPSGKATPS